MDLTNSPRLVRWLAVVSATLMVAGALAASHAVAPEREVAAAPVGPSFDIERTTQSTVPLAWRSRDRGVVVVDASATVEDLEVIEPPPDTFDAPLPPPAEVAPELASTSKANGTGVWAFVVGIDDYPGRNGDLESAVNDARDMEAALDLFGVPDDQRVVLTDRQAGRASILAGLEWLTDHAGPEATAVFFYAGHVRKLDRGREAIVASDGRVVTDLEVAARLDGLRAEETWVVMAACYGGGFDEVLGDGRILTAAASANHLAYENSRFNRSYLVQYFIREGWLEGRAGPSVQAAFDYSVRSLRESYPNRLPVQFDELRTPLVLGVVTMPTPPPRPSSQESASPPPSKSPSSGGGGSSPPPQQSPPPREQPEPEPDDRDCSLDGMLVRVCD